MSRLLENESILIIGGTRGLGRGMAQAAAKAGARVTVVGRTRNAIDDTVAAGEGNIRAEQLDATDRAGADALIAFGNFDVIAMVAGASPKLGPIESYDWDSFRIPFEVDVRATLVWVQAVLSAGWGGRLVVVSSGAALAGSPLSGGYAGAKQTQRYLCEYARDRATQLGVDLHVQCLLPQLNPNTRLGAAAVAAYADKAGEDVASFVHKRFGDRPLSPERAGSHFVGLLSDPAFAQGDEFMLAGPGLRPLP